MNRLAFLVACSLACLLAVANASAAPRTLPCVSYGDCSREAIPENRLFEMDFSDPNRYRAWLDQIGHPIVSGPTEQMHQACVMRNAASQRGPDDHASQGAISIGVADRLGNVCILPTERSWEAANRWCQSNGWRLHRYDGKTKVTCIIGADA